MTSSVSFCSAAVGPGIVSVPFSGSAELGVSCSSRFRSSDMCSSFDTLRAACSMPSSSTRTRVRELLDALALVRFGNKKVALRVDGQVVGAVELPSPTTGAAKRADDLQRLAVEDIDLLIGAVGHDQERLFRIDGKPDVPHRATAERVLRDERFAHERPIFPEDLNPIVRAIAHVNQTIVRNPHGVHDAELRRRRAVRIVLAGFVFVLHGAVERARQTLPRPQKIPIVGLLAVRAPVPFVGARCRVEHDDAMVHVAVGDIQLVGRRVDDHVRRGAEVLRVVAAGAFALTADLLQELAVAGELENVRVLVAAGAEPHTILMVDVDAVLELRPFVTRPRSTPRRDEIAILIELEDRRSRAPDRSRLVGLQRRWPMRNPDVVAGVDGDPGDRADDPVIRQRFRPRGVDAKRRNLRRRPRRERRGRPDRCQHGHRDHPARSHYVTSFAHSPLRMSGSCEPVPSTPSTSTSADPIMKSTWMALRLPPACSNWSSVIASAPVSVNLYAEPSATWLAAFSSNSVL